MPLHLVGVLLFLVAFTHFGMSDTQSKCNSGNRFLKIDVQAEVDMMGSTTINSTSQCVTREEVQGIMDDKAAKDVQFLGREINSTMQKILKSFNSTKSDIQELITDKATNVDVHEEVNEVLWVLNNNTVKGNHQHQLVMDILLQIAESQEKMENYTTQSIRLSSSHLEDVCATKDEIRTMIQEEMRSLQTEFLTEIHEQIIAEIQNNTAQILKSLKDGSDTEQTNESSTASPRIVHSQPTESGMTTTAATDTLYTCNGTPGWRQVIFINMTDTSYNCPPGLFLTAYSKRTCGRQATTLHNRGCMSTTFNVSGSQYSQVCGRIRGYQVGASSAFYGYLRDSQTIEGYYVDGISLTHGLPGARKHIWTFANEYSEVHRGYVWELCPCDSPHSGVVSPPFVGNDYFCESGSNAPWPGTSSYGVPYLDDPLWDGQDCTSASACCQFNNPPWFTKTLPNPTTDNIELRICWRYGTNIEDYPLELIELYVQ